MCENAEGGFTIDLGNGVYVHNIDVYTYDNLPIPDGINGIETAKTIDSNVYGIDGRIVKRNASLEGLPKGLYIVNGKKYLVKEHRGCGIPAPLTITNNRVRFAAHPIVVLLLYPFKGSKRIEQSITT